MSTMVQLHCKFWNLDTHFSVPEHKRKMEDPSPYKLYIFYMPSCWLSSEKGVVWSFIGPMLAVILVCGHNFL